MVNLLSVKQTESQTAILRNDLKFTPDPEYWYMYLYHDFHVEVYCCITGQDLKRRHLLLTNAILQHFLLWADCV